MQDVVRGPLGRTYAEPLSGLRVSWGSVLAGAVAALAVSVILWALAFAIVALATHASWSSVKGSIIALWICAMATTLVGAFVGGWVAGYLPGNGRRGIGVAHGFLAWCVALLLSLGFQLLALRNVADQATNALVQTASAALETTGAAAGGAAGSNVSPATRAEQTLMSLGYSREQARHMVGQEQTKIQNTLQGNSSANPGATLKSGAVSVGNTVRDYMVAAGWSWFGTWFVAALLAMAGGGLGVGVLRRTDREREPEPVYPGRPFTPAPTA